MIATATFVPARMQSAADADVIAATDLAEHLVLAGTPFREAHAIVGRLVRRSLAGEGGLAELAAAEIGADAAGLVQPGAGVQRRSSPGGAGPAAIGAQIDDYRAMLAAEASALRA
jgi:argininosuccinate lyase